VVVIETEWNGTESTGAQTHQGDHRQALAFPVGVSAVPFALSI